MSMAADMAKLQPSKYCIINASAYFLKTDYLWWSMLRRREVKMMIERKVNPATGVVELWNTKWENAEGKTAKKVFLNKICDEKQADKDADGAMAETIAICWANDRTMGSIAVSSPEYIGNFPSKQGTDALLPCDFVEAGKYRNGAVRMWCRTHQCHWGTKADIIALEDGSEMRCSSASQKMNYVVSPHTIDLSKHYEVGIWCSMPAAISTRKVNPRAPKIHVHVRERANADKTIDRDFPAVSIKYEKAMDLFGTDAISRVNITPPAAFEFVKGLELGHEMDCINCSHCGFPHLDMGDFAEKPHRKHFCANCGRDSTWSKKPIVSTPLKPLHDHFAKSLKYEAPDRSINLDEYPDCDYSIWASTPAIVWTADRPQEFGIHVHVHDQTKKRIFDDTYSEVILGGRKLDRAELVSIMMERTVC